MTLFITSCILAWLWAISQAIPSRTQVDYEIDYDY